MAVIAFAQQRPHYTQYILNNYILNPAISGIENYTDVKLSARDQWVGLNGAPRTAYLLYRDPLAKMITEPPPLLMTYREKTREVRLIGNRILLLNLIMGLV